MPKYIYIGDAVSVKNVTKNLIEKRALNVSVDIAEHYGERGEYYFENVQKGKWFVKYGIMNTLMFIPPLLAEKLWTGRIENYHIRNDAIFQNLYNIILSMMIAYILFSLAGLYSKSRLINFIYVILVFYSTFLWNFLRAQTFEIFQVLFFLLFYYFIIKFRRSVKRGERKSFYFLSEKLHNLLPPP